MCNFFFTYHHYLTSTCNENYRNSKIKKYLILIKTRIFKSQIFLNIHFNNILQIFCSFILIFFEVNTRKLCTQTLVAPLMFKR